MTKKQYGPVKKYVFVAAGFTTFVLGVIGIFLPILPTTPFLLLSAALFFRSSERLYHWITNHKVFGKYIKYYFEYRAVTRRSKIAALLLLWVVILSSVLFVAETLWLRILLIAVAVGVTIHIITIRTLTKEMIIKSRALKRIGDGTKFDQPTIRKDGTPVA